MNPSDPAAPRRSGVVVVIPAFNEAPTIARVVMEIKHSLDCEVVVIDDVSHDATTAAARAAGATVLPLPLKLGAWGATQTGLRYALRAGYGTAITMDADGQHLAEHLGDLLGPLAAAEADVVIGACPQRASPARRAAWRWFRLLTGLRLEDITSGFRAYNRRAMAVLASAEASLLDYQDVGVLLILRRRGLHIVEVPVAMRLRAAGASRVFSSWLVVAKYMLQTTLLSVARVGHNGLRRRRAPAGIAP